MSAAYKAKKEAKLIPDLQKEQQEMGKMMITQRQRKLYQKAKETRVPRCRQSRNSRTRRRLSPRPRSELRTIAN